MGALMEEVESWKCRKHPWPWKHRATSTGICPYCLRDRLIRLCPDCANVRPCACCPTTTTTSSSSTTTSSFSLSSSSTAGAGTGGGCSGIGAVGRISSLIDSEPAFRRSRSAAAFQFLRLRSSSEKDSCSRILHPPLAVPAVVNRSRSSSFWSIFKVSKTKKIENEREKEFEVTMMRSRSVGVSGCSDPGSDVRLKGRSWYFPSQMKVFRQQPKTATKVLQERSPLCRG